MPKNKIKCIHVGLGNFSIRRLEANLDSEIFEPVAFVDLDKKKAEEHLSRLKNIPKDYKKRIFKSISDACLEYEASACFIFVSSELHTKLCIESLENNLHTFCVKSIACNIKDFKKILEIRNKKNLLIIQGLNNKYSKASFELKKLLNDKNKFGDFIMGNCITWGRQNLRSEKPLVDSTCDGIFFHSMGCHQLCQLVEWLGMPEKVYCDSPNHKDETIGVLGVERTSSGVAILYYKNGGIFSYTATRAAHSNPFGFAARWSGSWLFNGSKCDIKREGGRVSVYKEQNMISDIYVDDLSVGLVENDKIQFRDFYKAIIQKENNTIEKNSLDTWVLMEALNESSRKKEKINIDNFKKENNLLY